MSTGRRSRPRRGQRLHPETRREDRHRVARRAHYRESSTMIIEGRTGQRSRTLKAPPGQRRGLGHRVTPPTARMIVGRDRRACHILALGEQGATRSYLTPSRRRGKLTLSHSQLWLCHRSSRHSDPATCSRAMKVDVKVLAEHCRCGVAKIDDPDGNQFAQCPISSNATLSPGSWNALKASSDLGGPGGDFPATGAGLPYKPAVIR